MATDRERTPYHDASDDIRPSIEDSEGETDNQRAGSSQPEGAQVQASERLDRSDRTGADPPEGERVLRSPSENGFTVADFENTDIRKMADAVDSLRDIGVGADIALPQLVVIGHQSSGKSSLLESLTRLPFPVGAGTCTRFAVEVALRRGWRERVQVTAVQNSDKQPNANLADFDIEFDEGFTGETFTNCLKDFSDRLGLPLPGITNSNLKPGAQRPGIASEMLKLEAKGPSYDMLSFVDTPGLFRSGSDNTSEEDAPKVRRLVRKLIEPERTIIVAVMDGRTDLENQETFSLAAAFDPQGLRTVGVLTRVDLIEPGNEREEAMRIAKNYKRPLDQGWFLVRNRTGLERQVGEKHLDIEQAHEAEESLFSTEPWVNLPSDRLGCRKLRGFLTSRFASHIQKEFPKIQNEILAKVDEANAQVRALGPPRNTPKQQRRYLHDIAHQYNRFVENCISGRHLRLQGPSVDEHSNINLQREIAKDSFLEQMTNRGCSWPFLRLEDESAYKYDIHADRSFQDMREDDEEAGRPSDQNIYAWINRHYHTASLPGCCGLISQELVLALFRSQIQPWATLAKDFISEVTDAVEAFVKSALGNVCEHSSVAEHLSDHLVATCLSRYDDAKTSVQDLFEKETMRMDTVDAAFADDVFLKKIHRLQLSLRRILENNLNLPEEQHGAYIAKIIQNDALALRGTMQYPRDAVYEIHDLLELYYSYAKQRFCDNVIRVGDTLIRSSTSALYKLDVGWVDRLSVGDLNQICGEDAGTTAQRRQLSEQIDRLRAAQEEVCNIIPEVHNRLRKRTPQTLKAQDPSFDQPDQNLAPTTRQDQRRSVSPVPRNGSIDSPNEQSRQNKASGTLMPHGSVGSQGSTYAVPHQAPQFPSGAFTFTSAPSTQHADGSAEIDRRGASPRPVQDKGKRRVANESFSRASSSLQSGAPPQETSVMSLRDRPYSVDGTADDMVQAKLELRSMSRGRRSPRSHEPSSDRPSKIKRGKTVRVSLPSPERVSPRQPPPSSVSTGLKSSDTNIKFGSPLPFPSPSFTFASDGTSFVDQALRDKKSARPPQKWRATSAPDSSPLPGGWPAPEISIAQSNQSPGSVTAQSPFR